MTFGSLFAGIGGFDLGFERAGMTCKWQVEIDPYARRVLAKHWPDVRRHDDVRTFPPVEGEWDVDVICGGFPCQPHSIAGERQAGADERDLWPEFARVIRVLKPRWVVAENVPGMLSSDSGRFVGGVFRDLARCGLDAEWDMLPAAAHGAHFVGERVFIVAQSAASGGLRRERFWTNPPRADGQNEFARLVERELSLCVSAGKGQRVSDGLSSRVDRLRGVGNAVDPRMSEWIGRRLMEIDN